MVHVPEENAGSSGTGCITVLRHDVVLGTKPSPLQEHQMLLAHGPSLLSLKYLNNDDDDSGGGGNKQKDKLSAVKTIQKYL